MLHKPQRSYRALLVCPLSVHLPNCSLQFCSEVEEKIKSNHFLQTPSFLLLKKTNKINYLCLREWLRSRAEAETSWCEALNQFFQPFLPCRAGVGQVRRVIEWLPKDGGVGRAGAASIPPGAGMAELQHRAWELLIVPISSNTGVTGAAQTWGQEILLFVAKSQWLNSSQGWGRVISWESAGIWNGKKSLSFGLVS